MNPPVISRLSSYRDCSARALRVSTSWFAVASLVAAWSYPLAVARSVQAQTVQAQTVQAQTVQAQSVTHLSLGEPSRALGPEVKRDHDPSEIGQLAPQHYYAQAETSLSPNAPALTVPVTQGSPEPVPGGTLTPQPILQPMPPPSSNRRNNDVIEPRFSAPRSTSTVRTVVDEGYLLGPDDKINITIFNVPEYSGDYQVLVDGTLNLPLVGTVPVEGMTIGQASTELANRYLQFLRRPIVTISVLQTRPIKLAIAGEVNRPGTYLGGAAANGGQVSTVTRLIQQAGGLTQSADLHQVQVRRVRPLREGGDLVISLDLWELLRGGDLRQDVVLRDGDSIFVPTANEINLAEARQLTSASFRGIESLPIKVAIVGEVNRPGPYTLQADEKTPVTTVTSAIEAAGGISQTADVRRIQIRRPTRTGDEQLIDVNLWALLIDGDLKQDLPLQEGDTVIIPVATSLSPDEVTKLASTSFSPDTITVYVVGEVGAPGAIKLPPNTPFNQALLAAGGFTNRARSNIADLVRLNPNGTVSKRAIDIKIEQGVNEEGNPPLRNYDTIIVSRSRVANVSDTLSLLLTPLAPITGLIGFLRLFNN